MSMQDRTNGAHGSESDEQAVIASIKLADDEWGSDEDAELCEALDEALMEAIDGSGTGEYDGIERGMGRFDIYAYGPDAEALAKVVLPVVRSFPVRRGSFVTVRHGGPGASETRTNL